ncbi:MAG: hypothetical protein A2144_13990, partial [Chloroflexi bacterium RBG_16_50_9]
MLRRIKAGRTIIIYKHILILLGWFFSTILKEAKSMGLRHFARVSLLVFILFAASVPTPVFAASGDETTTGSLSVVPTIECLGVVISYTGDNNQNNSAVLEYREAGGNWKTAPQMYADRTNRQYRGSIFWLTANTAYEVRVTFSDGDGVSGTNPVTGTTTTRNDNPPIGTRYYYVATTGSDTNPGTEAQPFRTIQKAASIVVAGDTVLVRAGTYNGTVTISRSGTAANYITFMPYGSEQVTLDGNGTLVALFDLNEADYIRIKGFTLQNSAYHEEGGLIRLKGGDDYCIIEDNTIINPAGIGGIMIRWGSSNNLVQRNTIRADGDTPVTGVFWWKAGGANVFIDNSITSTTFGLWDGMGGGPEDSLGYLYDTDIYNNTIIYNTAKNPAKADGWDRDDGLQPEGGNINVRIWNNRIENSNIGIASCPTLLGPTYIFRNVIINSFWEGFKLGNNSYGRIYIYHNTYYATQEADGYKQTDYGVGNIVSRNNIIHAGRKVIEANTVLPDVRAFDFDYDNLYTTYGTFAEYYCPTSKEGASTLSQFQSIGIEVHGISVADSKFANIAGGNFRLQSTSPNIDKGMMLTGFNDANSPWPYRGSAPDIGAYEY